MRITSAEAQQIKKIAGEHFGKESRVYLFGSRTDDRLKGGDIDLYIETDMRTGIFDKKISMLCALYKRLGEQKIDIVINNDQLALPVYEVAKSEGILL